MKSDAKPLLKEGDIIIAKEDIVVPGTGITFTFYIWKGGKYRVKEYLPLWIGPAWEIEMIGSANYNDKGWFTENDLLKKFDCLKWSRKEKLIKINKSL